MPKINDRPHLPQGKLTNLNPKRSLASNRLAPLKQRLANPEAEIATHEPAEWVGEGDKGNEYIIQEDNWWD